MAAVRANAVMRACRKLFQLDKNKPKWDQKDARSLEQLTIGWGEYTRERQ